jgi:hypothetical protein
MPYIRRTVDCGRVKEIKKMFTTRVHGKGGRRAVQTGATSERQQLINERRAEDELRWLLNTNFGRGDFHLVLHYYDKQITLKRAEQTLKRFLRLLRKALGRSFKYIAATETKRMTNVHHHIILERVDLQLCQDIWEQVVEGQGNVSLKPLDSRGQHGKLAHYLMKETRSTMKRYKELGKRRNRFKKSRNLDKPEVRYEVVAANSWAKEPKPRKGSYLYKFDNGESYRAGISENGWAWQEYFEIYEKPRKRRNACERK